MEKRWPFWPRFVFWAIKEKSPAKRRGRLIARGKLGNARERWVDISDNSADAIGHFRPKQYAYA